MLNFFFKKIMDAKSDVSIVGYHKCGNTWVSTFLRLYYTKKNGFSDDRLGKVFVNDYRIREMISFPKGVPGIHFTHALTDPETPDLPGVEDFFFRFRNKPMIVLTRNIKDVLVSSYMHSRYRETPAIFDGTLSEYIRSEVWGIRKVIRYYNEVAKFRADSSSRTTIVHYGDLWENPEAEFARLVQSLSAENVDEESLSYALEKSSFNNMRKLEDKSSSNNAVIPGLYKSTSGSEMSRKTRKAGVGGFVNEMSQEDIEYIDVFTQENLSSYWDFNKFLSALISK